MDNNDQNTAVATQTSSTPSAEPDAQGAARVDADAVASKLAKDIEAKAEKIAKETAAKIAGQKLKQIGSELSGEPAADPKKKILEHMVEDPIAYAHNLKEITKRELREELAEQAKIQNVQRSVVMPFVEEYPELNTPTKLALVERLADDLQRSGKEYATALKEACEATVKEFKLKSVSDAERESAARSAAFVPVGGAVLPGAPKFDEAKSNSDFFSGMKAKATSLRKRAQ